MEISSYVFYSIVLEHWLFHHYVSLYTVYEGYHSVLISLPLTHFISMTLSRSPLVAENCIALWFFWNSSLSLLHMHRVYPVIITWIHKLFPEFCIWDSAARNISVSMSFLHLEGPLRYRLRSGFWVRFNFFIFMNIHILFCRNHRQINIFTTGREFLSPCNHI